MKRVISFIPLLLIASLFISCSASGQQGHVATIHHDVNVRLEPERNMLTVEDSITLPPDRPGELTFMLHAGMGPITPTPGVRIELTAASMGSVPVEAFRISLPKGLLKFVLRYSGTIDHPLESVGRETARGFSTTAGTISEEGIFLAGNSLWYPRFSADFITFVLEASLPPGWDAVSQGRRKLHARRDTGTYVRWESPERQDDIYLVAARFTEYTRPAGRITAMVFLRRPDEKLAGKYLDATVRYVRMYEQLIGPYPYAKFALVENFWETGYGMPSFTLLGPRVIRFPFILVSSYPHEILHNWWGNSVYPDYREGNWSEGLTAYLSDHLLKEQQGKGSEYRQTTLQKYADYVLAGRDFPLTSFRSRHSSPSEAVGYGKSLMLFHMLRRELGDDAFTKGLQGIYGEHKFSFASFGDLRTQFERVSGKDLKAEFAQWITRTGAPELRLEDVETRRRGEPEKGRRGEGATKPAGGNYRVTFHLRQVQKGKAYRLRIPVAVTMEGRKQAFQTTVEMRDKDEEFALNVPARPLRIDIDPEFDLFRRLGRDEIPPAISQALGAQKMLILLPASAKKDLLKAYRALARAIGRSGPDAVDVMLDEEVKNLPADRTVTVLGWENRFFKHMTAALEGHDIDMDRDRTRIGKTVISRKKHSIVLSAKHRENKDLAMMFIATDSAQALPGLGRKLPHYHKYSYLGFEGNEPANMAKGRWPVLESSMTAFIPGKDGSASRAGRGTLAPREPLIALPPLFSSERMMRTITYLSDPKLKGRGFGSRGLDEAANYIAEQFREAGLVSGGDTQGSYFQKWKDRGGEPERDVMMKNVIGIIPGTKKTMAGQSVVIGAHYDHLGLGWPDVRKKNRGRVHPGADDNASGVAMLIELAGVLKKSMSPDRSVVFVAFTGEEAGRRGSKHYVSKEKRHPAAKVMGMLNLDTVGRLNRKKLYVLGAESACEWVHIFRGAGFVTGAEIETVAEPLDSSDQVSFQEAGVPAVQMFTGPHIDYHRPGDRAGKIDSDGLVSVAAVAKEVIEYLAAREEPLTTTGTGAGKAGVSGKKKRTVSLGTIPDFSFKGEGCRISGVLPGSPAEACGLQEGDIIIGIDDKPVHDLRELSKILKTLKAGDRISIRFLRKDKEMTKEAEVVER